jgi:hypothetical protein
MFITVWKKFPRRDVTANDPENRELALAADDAGDRGIARSFFGGDSCSS